MGWGSEIRKKPFMDSGAGVKRTGTGSGSATLQLRLAVSYKPWDPPCWATRSRGGSPPCSSRRAPGGRPSRSPAPRTTPSPRARCWCSRPQSCCSPGGRGFATGAPEIKIFVTFRLSNYQYGNASKCACFSTDPDLGIHPFLAQIRILGFSQLW